MKTATLSKRRMPVRVSDRLSIRKKDREEGYRYIESVIIPRLQESWLQLGKIYRPGRYCPVLANNHRNVGIRVFIADRMDRAAGGNIVTFNDSAKSLDDVIDVLRVAATP